MRPKGYGEGHGGSAVWEDSECNIKGEFNVPRKTLDDRVKGQVVQGSNPGPPTALTSDEEGALVSYLLTFNPDAIDKSKIMPSLTTCSSSADESSDTALLLVAAPSIHQWAVCLSSVPMGLVFLVVSIHLQLSLLFLPLMPN